MGKINNGRVLLGGLAAGLVINVSEGLAYGVVLAERMDAALAALNLEPVGGGAIGVFVVYAFVLGILTVWLYAAVRARFGPGPKTAAIAGSIVWILAFLGPTVHNVVQGMLPVNLAITAAIWGLAEVLIAAEVGAFLYKEEGARAAAGIVS